MGSIARIGTVAVVFINGVYYSSSPWYNPCERIHEEFPRNTSVVATIGMWSDRPATSPVCPASLTATAWTFKTSSATSTTTPSPRLPSIPTSRAGSISRTSPTTASSTPTGDGRLARQQLARGQRPQPERPVALHRVGRGMGHGHLRPHRFNQFLHPANGGPTDSGLASVASSEIAQPTTASAPVPSSACSGPTAFKTFLQWRRAHRCEHHESFHGTAQPALSAHGRDGCRDPRMGT